MGHGIQYYPKKEKRAMRRRNHMARDLEDRKFRQRVLPNKKHKDVNDWQESLDD